MHKVCTIVPTHQAKFNHALDFLRTHNKFVTTDLFFSFSSYQEEEIFRKLVETELDDNQRKDFCSLILNGLMYNRGIVTQKKLYSVNELVKTYDYVAVFDDETIFVKPFDTLTAYKEIADSKVFKSNRRNNHLYHLIGVAEKMNLSTNQRLIEETDNFTQYWWFNDICVYDAKYFPEFFKWLTTHPNFQSMMSDFICFDYLIYSLWLICFKDFKLEKKMQQFTFGAGAIETNYCDDTISEEFKSYADRNINHENIEHIKVQIMLDRSKEFLDDAANKQTYG